MTEGWPAARASASPKSKVQSERASSEVAADECVARLVRHGQAVSANGEPEDVHQLRVCAARLRVWLRLAGITTLHDDLGWLRTAAASVRDLDVQLEAAPPRALTQRLARQRSTALAELQRCLTLERYSALISALRALPPVSIARATNQLHALAARSLSLGQQRTWRAMAEGPTSAQSESVHALHRLRRSVRRVRYALNWLGLDARDITDLQEALGDVCNGVLHLSQAASPAATNKAFRLRQQQELLAKASSALLCWKHTKPILEKLVHAPVHHTPRTRRARQRDAARRGATTH